MTATKLANFQYNKEDMGNLAHSVRYMCMPLGSENGGGEVILFHLQEESDGFYHDELKKILPP